MERKLIPFPLRLTARQRRDEREFLPAALEIIETPVSAAGRVMMGILVVLVAVAIVWACLGELDIVASANGRIIQDNMRRIAAGRTVIVIAHRLSAVRGADRIVTLDRGRLVEDGTHEDLVRRGGRYAQLYRLQAGRADVA